MKKLFSILAVAIVIALVAPSITALACDCTCDACKGCKEKEEKSSKKSKFETETNKLLKQIKKTAKKYGWTISTEVTEQTKKKMVTRVSIVCPDHNGKRVVMDDMEIRATKKNGVVTADWYFFKESESQWKHTSSERICKVLVFDD